MNTYPLWFYLQDSPNSPSLRKTGKGLQIEAESPDEAASLARGLVAGYADQASFAKLYDPEGNEIAEIDMRRAPGA